MTTRQNKTIDWNVWHNPVINSIEAFDIETAAKIAKDYNLNWNPTEYDPVGTQSLYSVLRETCEDLIVKFNNDWKYSIEEKLEHNTYYDDSGVLTEEINMYQQTEDDDDDMIMPILKVQLRKDTNDNEMWFSIELIVSSQLF
jgi:hypothetical protein